MPTVKFSTGQSVNFANTPSAQDIQDVADKLGIDKPQTQTPQPSLGKRLTSPGLFPASPNDSALTASAKVVGNTIPSALNFGKQAINFLNPVNTSKTVAQLPSAFKGLQQDQQNEQQGAANLAGQNNQLVQQYQQMKASGKDTSHLEAFAKQQGIDLTTQVNPLQAASNVRAGQFGINPIKTVTGLTQSGYQGLVPKFFQQLFAGDTKGAQETITNDPSGQLLPIILGAKSMAEQAGYGPQFDEAVSKTASPIIKPVSATARFVGDTTGKLGSQLLGTSTGAGASSISEAFKGSPAFTDAMRGKTSPEQVVQSAQDMVSNIANNRRTQYLADLAKIGDQKGSLDISPVHTELQTQLNNFGVKVSPDGTLDFSRSSIANNGSARADVQGVYDTLKDWGTQKGDRTAVGLDTLKKQLGDFYSQSSSARALVQAVKSKVSGLLKDQVPGYADMTSSYSKASNLLDDIKSATGVGGKAGIDAAFTKMTTALRSDKALRLEVLKEMQATGNTDLTGQLAGMNMRSLVPTGLVGKGADVATAIGALTHVFNPEFIPLLLSTSPRIVGEFVRTLGLGLSKTRSVLDAVNNITAPGGLSALNEKTKIPLGLSTKDVSNVPNIHPEDQQLMNNYIDAVRLKKPIDSQLELGASRIAEHYGLKMPGSPSGLANSFDAALASIRTKYGARFKSFLPTSASKLQSQKK